MRLVRAVLQRPSAACSECRRRIHISPRFLAQPATQQQSKTKPLINLPPKQPPAPNRAIAPPRIRKGYDIKPIGAPIGFPQPPKVGQNWFNIETAGETYLERNAAKGNILWKQYDKSYIRDFRNMDVNRGKFYLANSRLYKKDAAQYFPNIQGRTLGRAVTDTTEVLQGKVSVVSLFSRNWAEEQTQTFVGEEENSELLRLVQQSNGVAQLVDINHEEFKLASFMLSLFEWNLRRIKDERQHNRYFIMRGLPQTVKDYIALMNDKVGYVFLLDRDCKIRWSACGDANEEEKESLLKGLKKLIDEKSA